MTTTQLPLTIEEAMKIVQSRYDEKIKYKHISDLGTFFGRHSKVYEFLGNKIIPKLMKDYDRIVVNDIGLGLTDEPSTEPYELANQLEKNEAEYDIYAFDIDSKVVEAAKKLEKIDLISQRLLNIWLEKPDLLTRLKEWWNYQRNKNIHNLVINTYGMRKKSVEYIKAFFTENQEYNEGELFVHIPESVKQKIHFQIADIITTTPANRSDITFFANVLQHLPDGDAEVALTNVVNLTKEGGYLFLDAYSYPKDIKLSKYGLSRATIRSFGPGQILLKKDKEINYEEMLMQSSLYRGKVPMTTRLISGALSSISLYSMGSSLIDLSSNSAYPYLNVGASILTGWLGSELLITTITGEPPFAIMNRLRKITNSK